MSDDNENAEVEAELDDWFENTYGGHERFLEQFGDEHLPRTGNADLDFGASSYMRLFDLGLGPFRSLGAVAPWSRLSKGAKRAFRNGIEATAPDVEVPEDEIDSVIDDLAPLPVVADPYERRTRAGRLKVALVAASAVAVAAAIAGVAVSRSGDDTSERPSAPAAISDTSPPTPQTTGASATAAPETSPPIVQAVATTTPVATEATEPPQFAVADIEASVPPSEWIFTATKTASLLPAPAFITATPDGTELPWSVAITESCLGETCTYSSRVWPLNPEPVIGEVPEAEWAGDGSSWSLTASWLATQASYPDGTECVIRHEWVYDFEVTSADVVDGRSVASAIAGIWLQSSSLDLAESTGDLEACGDEWQLLDEWSVVGQTGETI